VLADIEEPLAGYPPSVACNWDHLDSGWIAYCSPLSCYDKRYH
jgi:hypothetical protein